MDSMDKHGDLVLTEVDLFGAGLEPVYSRTCCDTQDGTQHLIATCPFIAEVNASFGQDAARHHEGLTTYGATQIRRRIVREESIRLRGDWAR